MKIISIFDIIKNILLQGRLMKKYLFLIAILFNLSHAEHLGTNEELGKVVPLDLKFLDENSNLVTLKSLMNGKPTLLTLNYFECAGVCTPQLMEMSKMIGRLRLAENTDYKVITVDFAENESVILANSKKKSMLNLIGRPYVKDAWHFVIGDNNSSGKLAKAVGFKYKKVLNSQGKYMGYMHSATIIVLSPTGKIIRYLKGVEQLASDVTLAIKEAKAERVSTSIAKDEPFCFTEKPKADILVNKVTKSWMIIMLMVVIGLFVYLLKTTKNKKKPEEE